MTTVTRTCSEYVLSKLSARWYSRMKPMTLVATLLTWFGLALLGASPALAQTQILPFETFADDGTALRGHLYLPESIEPLATVLQVSPYWNSTKAASDQLAGDEAVKPFLDAGFAVALINMRGSGASDGCFQFGSQLDWTDTASVIAALAAEPWSNGNIGMYGTSYEGWTQYMGMAEQAPALKAVVPISGVIDLWSLLTREGAPITVGPVTATVADVSTSLVITNPALVTHIGCAEHLEHVTEGLGLITTGDRTPYYQSRDLRALLEDSPVPVLMTNGFTYFHEGHTLQFEGLWDLLSEDRTRFILGQWGHGGKRDDFNALAVGWFDHYLRGAPQTTVPGIVEYQDDRLDWHSAPSWPPPATSTVLHLSADELTNDPAAVVPSARSFQSLDLDTGVDAVGVVLSLLTASGTPSAIAEPGPLCGPHQVLYSSPPLAGEIRIAGNFTVDLMLSSNLPGGNLVATLYRVTGSGDCLELLSASADMGRVQMDLRHWQESGVSRPFPSGGFIQVLAKSMPLASVVAPGERLVLAIGAGSAEILPDLLKPRITVATGSTTPSTLTLPVVEGTLSFQTNNPPPVLRRLLSGLLGN